MRKFLICYVKLRNISILLVLVLSITCVTHLVFYSLKNSQQLQIHTANRFKIINKFSPAQIAHVNSDFKTQRIVLENMEIKLVQQINALQNGANCSGPVFLCGHNNECGLGCQLHHRSMCLALSIYYKIPLIHLSDYFWPFKQKWSEVFFKMGTNCSSIRSRKRYLLKWHPFHIAINGPDSIKIKETFGKEFPFKNGLIVPRSIGQAVASAHKNPFLWWIGQFLKYSFRFSPNTQAMVNKAKLSLGLPIDKTRIHDLIGIHIRRTDKLNETPNFVSKVETYFLEVWKIMQKFGNDFKVFLASEDHTVLDEARAHYPNITILGFPAFKTTRNQKARNDELSQAIRDIKILSSSEFVICNQDSNVCRVITELFAADDPDGQDRVISVQYEHYVILYGQGYISSNVSYYLDN